MHISVYFAQKLAKKRILAHIIAYFTIWAQILARISMGNSEFTDLFTHYSGFSFLWVINVISAFWWVRKSLKISPPTGNFGWWFLAIVHIPAHLCAYLGGPQSAFYLPLSHPIVARFNASLVHFGRLHIWFSLAQQAGASTVWSKIARFSFHFTCMLLCKWNDLLHTNVPTWKN